MSAVPVNFARRAGSWVQTPTGQFSAGEVATYSLDLDASEYAASEDIVLTDTLPNGTCPLMSQTQWDALVAAHPSLGSGVGAEECVAAAGQQPTLSDGSTFAFDTVTFDPATGAFTVTFTPIASLAANSSVRATYRAGAETDRLDLLHGVSLPDAREHWVWELAPFGEASRRHRLLHHVRAFPDWHAAESDAAACRHGTP